MEEAMRDWIEKNDQAAGEPEWLIKAIENPKPVEQEQIDAYYQFLKKTGKRMTVT